MPARQGIGSWVSWSRALVLVVVLATTAAGCSAFGDDASSTTTVPNGVPISEVDVGMCYLAPEDTDVVSVERIGCRKPHDAEAYAVFDVEAGEDDPFPGGAAVQSFAQAGCQTRFADYVGQPYEDSEYYFSAIAPTRTSWDDDGDRRVLCSVLAAAGGELNGSVKAG